MNDVKTSEMIVRLEQELATVRWQLEDAMDTIEAIRTGQVDALVVNEGNGNAIYTLRSADHSYRVFVEKMMEGAVTLDREGVVMYANSSFAKMVGVEESMLGSAFIDHVHESSKEQVQRLLELSWDAEFQEEIKLVTGLPVKLSLTALEMDDGLALSIFVTDLSSQKAVQRELKEKNDQLESLNTALALSNTDLQQFASVASHDLQEPLRKIQVFSNFITDHSHDELDPTSRRYLGKILFAAQRMKVLIQDILNYSRLSATDAMSQEVNLNEVVAEVLDDFELIITDKGATVDVSELPVIEGNRGQLRQVFQNLISNALKFSQPGIPPIITVKGKPLDPRELRMSLSSEAYCRICITDNGIGFDQKFAHSIFNLFEMLHPKSSYEGSGIGLAIAKKIIEKHHGFILAKGLEHKGAEFNIILPRRRALVQ